MGLLKHIHENSKAAMDAPINPLIADGGAQFIARDLSKAIVKVLDLQTEEYVFEGKKR